MGLFGRKKKAEPAKLSEITFMQAGSFRGFKRFRLTNYGYEPAQIGLRKLRIENPEYNGDDSVPKYIFDFKNKLITIREIEFEVPAIAVFVDGNQIGSLFSTTDEEKNMINKLFSDGISSAYAKVEYKIGAIAYTDKKDNLAFAPTEKYMTYLLVKFEEE